MTSYILIWITCSLFVILKGGLNHFLTPEWLDFNLIPAFLLYLIAMGQSFRGIFLAFFMGIFTDIFAPCEFGVFTLSYTAAFLVMNGCQQFLNFNNIKTSILFCFLFILVNWALVLIVIGLFPLRQIIVSVPFISILASALISSFLVPPVFFLLNLLRERENQNYE